MRYYLSIPVPTDLSDRVSAFEKKWQGASKSDPHITLVIPRMLRAGKGEAELVSRLDSALSLVPEFPVRMTGCGYFGNKRVIHIRVERSPEFAYCHEASMLAVADLLEAATGEHASISHPHITLATKLSPEKGEKAWQEARTQNWFGEFVCDRVQLLRMAPNELRWTVAATLRLPSYYAS